MDDTSLHAAQRITLPPRVLIVLCGPAGAGKSTFARRFVKEHQPQGYRSTSIVSSDHCRAVLCDDEANQQVNRDTFDLFYYLIHKRLFYGRSTLADSTALQRNARQRLLDIAANHHYATCLLLFNVSFETCMAHDQRQSRGRVVGEKVIRYHQELLQQAIKSIPHEGWQAVHVLDEHHPFPEFTFTPAAPPSSHDHSSPPALP